MTDIAYPTTLSTTAGITASTSQSQGNGALSSQLNQISTVGNADDVVTLPAAFAGLICIIDNDGANVLQIFPASGDDLGAGVNLSVQLEPNEAVEFTAFDSTNWHSIASTEIIHAEMFDTENTDEYTINDSSGFGDFHLYHTNGLAAGDLAGWTFDAGGGGSSFAVDEVVQASADIRCRTTSAHGFVAGDIVSLTNFSDGNYAGVFVVQNVSDTTHFDVTATFASDGTGTAEQGAALKCGVGRAGAYLVMYSVAAFVEANNDVFDFTIFKQATRQATTNQRRKYGIGADVGSVSGVSIIDVADNDQISFGISNTTGEGEITVRDFTLVLVRL